MYKVLLCVIAVSLFKNPISNVWSQPIDSFDDSVPLSDMDILTENNPDKTDEGDPLIEGDIVLPPMPDGNSNDIEDELETRKGMLNVINLWPSGRVSYNFHSSVSKQTKERIREAMDKWENETCLRFHETLVDFSYIRFRTDKSGCWSLVGRQNQPFRGQDVSIGPGCERVSVITHEVGHAIGLYHEQSRIDRDRYVNILWNNIPPGMTSQFSQGMDFPRGVEYDYTSIMHYSAMAFSKAMFEKNTITTKNPHYQRLIGSGRVISFRDAKLVNRMYSCNSFCPNLFNESQQCENNGYLAPYRNDGKDCACNCPPGTSGERCENVIYDGYYSPPICGGNVTEETEIKTPGYPFRNLPIDPCSWWIQAPYGKRVMVTFDDFSFAPRLVASRASKYRNRCLQERVEIRTRSMAEGNMYCGEDIKPGTNLQSTGRQFMIIINTNGHDKDTRGLKAKITFT
ncbi:blastula protease 10-like [Parasteatoda tepidariorum]|uniref:blastula protease 10-like n=1 Tax=Parasteatoda tepidariorum TaxID=114398 RepID=UPI00077FAB93